MEEFFMLKNKKISRQYSDCFSVRDQVVQTILEYVTEYMVEHDSYTISWGKIEGMCSGDIGAVRSKR